MQLHADLTRPALVHADQLDWVPSPMPGVERRRIARMGDEVARVTSLVRYAPDSAFSPHTHGGGEEFLVLAGTFGDDLADSPTGTWVRNGVGSRHTPSIGPEGCLILVKLWWLHPDETDSARIDTTDATRWQDHGPHRHLPLHQGRFDRTRLIRPAPDQALELSTEGGLELFVVEGGATLVADGVSGPLRRWSWLRLPGPSPLRVTASSGTTLYVKRGHLAQPPPLPDTAR